MTSKCSPGSARNTEFVHSEHTGMEHSCEYSERHRSSLEDLHLAHDVNGELSPPPSLPFPLAVCSSTELWGEDVLGVGGLGGGSRPLGCGNCPDDLLRPPAYRLLLLLTPGSRTPRRGSRRLSLPCGRAFHALPCLPFEAFLGFPRGQWRGHRRRLLPNLPADVLQGCREWLRRLF